MSKKLRKVVCCLFLCLVAGLSLCSATESTEPKNFGFNMMITVSLVQVTATVTDSWGRTVFGLTADDFEIFENGEKKKIVHFENARAFPKQILILLDVSGSMRLMNKIGAAKRSLESLLKQLKKDDQVELIFFADGDIELAVPYTTDKEKCLQKIWDVGAYGRTALRDAVKAAHRYASANDNYQRAMLLITDGMDNASTVTLEEAIDSARKVDLPVYVIGIDPVKSRYLTDKAEREKAIFSMEALANETGGRFTHAGTTSEILSALGQMVKDLENQYLLTFESRTSSGGKHEIIVKTKRRSYKVRARKGYFVANE